MKNLLKFTFITLFTFALTASISAQGSPGWDEGVAASHIKLLPIGKEELKKIFVGNIPSVTGAYPLGKNLSFYANARQNIFAHISGEPIPSQIQISARTLKVLKKDKNLKAFAVKGYIIFVDKKGKEYKSGLKKAALRAILK